MVAFSGFYKSQEPPPLGNSHGIVLIHHDGHGNGQQSGHILHCRFVCCCPGGHRGDTERVVARWWRLVAFMKALDLLHQEMHRVLHCHTTMAIKRPAMEVLSFVVANFFAWHNRG